MIDWTHLFKAKLTFKVSILNVRIYKQVESEVIREYSILDLQTDTDLHHVYNPTDATVGVYRLQITHTYKWHHPWMHLWHHGNISDVKTSYFTAAGHHSKQPDANWPCQVDFIVKHATSKWNNKVIRRHYHLSGTVYMLHWKCQACLMWVMLLASVWKCIWVLQVGPGSAHPAREV